MAFPSVCARRRCGNRDREEPRNAAKPVPCSATMGKFGMRGGFMIEPAARNGLARLVPRRTGGGPTRSAGPDDRVAARQAGALKALSSVPLVNSSSGQRDEVGDRKPPPSTDQLDPGARVADQAKQGRRGRERRVVQPVREKVIAPAPPSRASARTAAV